MKLRRGIPDDAEGITRVHVASWRSAYRGLVPDPLLDQVDMSARAERWRGILGADNWPIFVQPKPRKRRIFSVCNAPFHNEMTDMTDRPRRSVLKVFLPGGFGLLS